MADRESAGGVIGRSCTVCDHAKCAEIDRALVGGDGSNRRIASQYALSEAAVRRHKADHLPATLTKAKEAAETVRADDLLDLLRRLRNKAVGILLQAERSGELKTALLGIREARACIELLAELEGELDRRANVSITISADWIALRAEILAALAPYPDARLALTERLVMIGAHHGQ